MRTVLFIALMLAACSTAPPPQNSPVPISELTAEDRQEISGIFEQWERAWQAHDMHAWAQLFHNDGTYITWFGDALVGREAIENAMVQAHRTVFRTSEQLSRPEEIRMVAPGVVVARSFTTLRGDAREPQSTIYGRKLIVITQRDGQWRILHGQAVRLSGRAVEAVRQQQP
jgi:uncharacterized protein (TIGR02246 family)